MLIMQTSAPLQIKYLLTESSQDAGPTADAGSKIEATKAQAATRANLRPAQLKKAQGAVHWGTCKWAVRGDVAIRAEFDPSILYRDT
jgi:hypothetical protein